MTVFLLPYKLHYIQWVNVYIQLNEVAECHCIKYQNITSVIYFLKKKYTTTIHFTETFMFYIINTSYTFIAIMTSTLTILKIENLTQIDVTISVLCRL